MDLEQLSAVLFVGLGAIAQSITGIGFSLICAPLLTVALGGADGVRINNALSIGVNLFVLSRERRGADMRKAASLLIPAVLAIPGTAFLLQYATPKFMAIIVGLITLLGVFSIARGLQVKALSGKWGAVIAGFLSGAMNVSGGVGGPPAASYAMNAKWPIEIFRPTMAFMGLGLNVASTAARGIP